VLQELAGQLKTASQVFFDAGHVGDCSSAALAQYPLHGGSAQVPSKPWHQEQSSLVPAAHDLQSGRQPQPSLAPQKENSYALVPVFNVTAASTEK
jgi:hypothetical protein